MPIGPSSSILLETSLLDEPGLDVSILSTKLGHIGIVSTDAGLVATRVGYTDEEHLVHDLSELVPLPPRRGTSSLARRLVAYADGKPDSFEDVQLDLRFVTGGRWTAFRAAVTRLCRSIPRGRVQSYLELAEQAGAPRGARAAGSVMARNPWPIVVPCHRVVGSGGSLGGYSAPTGLAFKRQLLDLEARSSQDA
jgi:methylated-DNA-[protein]-cysteine S-methyltransferase